MTLTELQQLYANSDIVEAVIEPSIQPMAGLLNFAIAVVVSYH